jgi:hypothetical protein
MTLRTRIPVLLMELMEKNIYVLFEPDRFGNTNEMTIAWGEMVGPQNIGKTKNGHAHLQIEPGVHGANSIVVEKYLSKVLDEVNEAT